MFANTLESFGAFDLGITLTLKVKVTRPFKVCLGYGIEDYTLAEIYPVKKDH